MIYFISYLYARSRNNALLGLIYIKFRMLKRSLFTALIHAFTECVSQLSIYCFSDAHSYFIIWFKIINWAFQHDFVIVTMMLNFVSRGRWRGIAGRRSGGYLPGSKVLLLLFCSWGTELQRVVVGWGQEEVYILSNDKTRLNSYSIDPAQCALWALDTAQSRTHACIT